jgi:ribosomal protein L10
MSTSQSSLQVPSNLHLFARVLTSSQVSVDNVSSQQMHEIRSALRGEAVVLMGKNTMVRRALKGFIGDNPEYERLLPHVKGKIMSQEKQ